MTLAGYPFSDWVLSCRKELINAASNLAKSCVMFALPKRRQHGRRCRASSAAASLDHAVYREL